MTPLLKSIETWPERHPRAALGLVCLLQGLWLAYLGNTLSLAGDDFFTVEFITSIQPDEDQAPLYYWCLRAWKHLAGLSQSGLRSFSLLLALISTVRFTTLARRFVPGSMVATCAWAFLPLLTSTALDLRCYTLYAWLAVEYYLAVFDLADRPNWRAGSVAGAVAAALLMTHFFAVPFTLAGAAWVVANHVARRGFAAQSVPLLLATVAVTLYQLYPMLVGVRRNVVRGLSEAHPHAKLLLRDFVNWLFATHLHTESALVAIGAMAAILLFFWWRHPWEGTLFAIHLASGAGALSLGVSAGIFMAGYRYIIYFAVFFVLALSWSISRVPRIALRYVVSFLVVLCLAGLSAGIGFDESREDTKGAVANLCQRWKDGDQLLTYDHLALQRWNFYKQGVTVEPLSPANNTWQLQEKLRHAVLPGETLWYLRFPTNYHPLFVCQELGCVVREFTVFGTIEIVRLEKLAGPVPYTISIESPQPEQHGVTMPEVIWSAIPGARQYQVVMDLPGGTYFRYRTPERVFRPNAILSGADEVLPSGTFLYQVHAFGEGEAVFAASKPQVYFRDPRPTRPSRRP